uniref:Putative lipocalin n=1 Tax=Rhipicephalus microplus TaxID=6941 RepID=A0A6G5A3S9_RHIMP
MDILYYGAILQLFLGANAYHQQYITGHGTLGQLLVLLNTSDPFWLITRSYTIPTSRCVYALKKKLNGSYYEFGQYYLKNDTPTEEHLYAILSTTSEGDQGATFTVHKK